ncbi:MAG: hypothetical protein HGA19_04505 [Oscillochloris sp.]|nr:hypothetical protein [Oscillochloris sp.]
MSDSTPLSLWSRIHARWWYLWGLSLCYSGNRSHDQSFYRAGVDSFSRALQIWPAYAAAHYRRGLIRGRELGEHPAAIVDLTRASELLPEWAEPYLQRGLFQRFHGDPHVAMIDLEHYVALAEPGYWLDEAKRQILQLQTEL